jgi:hypothetical protein
VIFGDSMKITIRDCSPKKYILAAFIGVMWGLFLKLFISDELYNSLPNIFIVMWGFGNGIIGLFIADFLLKRSIYIIDINDF